MPGTPRRKKRPAVREVAFASYDAVHHRRVLLDTNAFLWFGTDSKRLSPVARRIIEDTSITVFVSAASIWEIAIKRALGKLPLVGRFAPAFPAVLRQFGFTELQVTANHAELAGGLPRHHSDPFDRMLIAQAMLEDLVVVTNDPLFEPYSVRRIW